MKDFFKKMINENPVLVLTLGMCPTLAVTVKFENAIIMGLAVTIVLILSNFIISIISKIVDKRIRIPSYILVIAGLVTILELLMDAYIPTMYKILGIYIPLIVVNCIILARAESYASKNNPIKSILDGLSIGMGFTLAISLVAIIREVLGTGTLTIIDSTTELFGDKIIYIIFNNPINMFVTPAGAFITLGILVAIISKIKHRKEVVE